jgi:hypothetical protein
VGGHVQLVAKVRERTGGGEIRIDRAYLVAARYSGVAIDVVTGDVADNDVPAVHGRHFDARTGIITNVIGFDEIACSCPCDANTDVVAARVVPFNPTPSSSNMDAGAIAQTVRSAIGATGVVQDLKVITGHDAVQIVTEHSAAVNHTGRPKRHAICTIKGRRALANGTARGSADSIPLVTLRQAIHDRAGTGHIDAVAFISGGGAAKHAA